VEASEPQARGHGIVLQPGKTELIARRQEDHNGSGSRNVWECKSEFDGRMRGLTCLTAWGQVATGNDKQPTRRTVLAMRHISIVAVAASYALGSVTICRRCCRQTLRVNLAGRGVVSPM
jgi:hypothetical protein